ncbi:hypothetical protein A4X09_0g1332 [Tilletia walkeri]|uniref:SP-RING-type domain-containing protein n=1 Tax=Tilletia walkeri TaxID=117179 RepID=A0A8X7NEL5_9BASI|nr:hypothetical protein A4X09_0g1332 [Tilletia walkeri]
MARASTRSRQSHGRRAEDDEEEEEIEQTQPTQKRSRISMPGSQAAASSSSSQRKGKGRASAASQASAMVSDDEVDDDEEEEEAAPARIPTVDEIKQQTKATPLNARLVKPKLNMHVTEYESALGKATSVLEYLGDAALAVEELFEDGETDLIGQLDSSVREVIDSQYEMDIRQKVLRSMVNSLDQNREIVSPVQVYKETVEKAMERYKTKTSRQKYVKSDAYQKFRSIIWEVHNGGSAMPSLTEHIPAEQGDEADDDVEDFEQGGVAQNFRCPLTTAFLEDPMSSTLCPHSYSKTAIEAYIASQARARRPALCPQSGCNAQLTPNSLKADTNLAKRVAIHLRRLQTQTQTQQAQSGSAAHGGAGARGAKKGAKNEGGQEDAIEEVEDGSDDEEEIELD